MQLLREYSFDIIFLDHMMPQMDGIETFRKMQEEELGEGVPVIMLTANAIVGSKEMYLKEGFHDFLQNLLCRRSWIKCLCSICRKN